MAEARNLFEDFIRKLKKDKKALLTVCLGIAGMLLVVLSELPFSETGAQGVKESNSTHISSELERETEKLISQIKGAGKVSVMLTFESNEEKIYAKNTDEKTKGDEEKQIRSDYIVVDSSDGETGLTLKVIYPRIRGVAVVCSGGDDPVVRGEISAVVSALFDIGTNRISIAPRAEEE